jgi:uncharacterized protein YegJ (DUF2314 family)
MKRLIATIAAALCFAAPHAAWAQKGAAGAATVGQQGSGDDVVSFAAEDAEMNAAMDEARRTLPMFMAEFNAAPAHAQGNYSVKVGMTTRAGTLEHIWVANLRRENGRLRGALANEPYDLEGLRLGDLVDIDESAISDWAIESARGQYGSFTTRVIVNHIDAATADQIRATLAPTPLPPHWVS